MHCSLMIDFTQDSIGLIGSRINVINTPSTSDISAAIVLTPKGPNPRMNVGRFEAISSIVLFETGGQNQREALQGSQEWQSP
jgi:hypothetical protein